MKTTVNTKQVEVKIIKEEIDNITLTLTPREAYLLSSLLGHTSNQERYDKIKNPLRYEVKDEFKIYSAAGNMEEACDLSDFYFHIMEIFKEEF